MVESKRTRRGYVSAAVVITIGGQAVIEQHMFEVLGVSQCYRSKFGERSEKGYRRSKVSISQARSNLPLYVQ